MPRKRSYDENVVLEKAMFAFWDMGFKGSTTRDLAQAMGINQFSVYASFENKEILFGRALQHYYETVFQQGVLLPLSGADANLDDLQRFLEQFVGDSAHNFPNGCFICNSMIEAHEMNAQVDTILQNYRIVMIDTLQKVLRNSFPQADKDFVHNKAEFLYGAFLGLSVQKRMGIDSESVQTYINEIMNTFSWLQTE